MRPRHRKLAASLLALVTFLLGSAKPAPTDQDPPPVPVPPERTPPLNEPLNKKFTGLAWAAFQAKDYPSALTNAEQCIARFGAAAERIQAVLEDEKIVLPLGSVTDAERKQIEKYQILHDVATCWLLKGWAKEALGETEEARQAFQQARKLTAARSSRSSPASFWSPAAKAAERLSE